MEGYFVIHQSEEDSYSTVPASDVVCEESVEVGDTVTLFYNRKSYEGTVCHINEDRDVCVKTMQKIMREDKMQRQDSFHEDRKRKAALKFTESLRTNKKKKNEPTKSSRKTSSKKPKQKTNEKKKAEKATSQLLLASLSALSGKPSSEDATQSQDDDLGDDVNTPDELNSKDDGCSMRGGPNNAEKPDGNSSEGNSSSCDISDVSSDESSDCTDAPSKKEKKVMKLAASLAAKYDMQSLRDLATSKKGILKPEKNSKNSQSSTVAQKKSFIQRQGQAFTVKQPMIESGKAHVNDHQKDCKNTGTSRRRLAPKIYEGPMYVVQDESEGIVINPSRTTGEPIYCLKDSFEKAEAANSATQAARRLLDGVFTLDAIINCSLSGMPPRGKGKAAYENKATINPQFDPHGVTAIIDRCKDWEKEKKWHPKRDRPHIRHAMSVRAHEIAAAESGQASD